MFVPVLLFIVGLILLIKGGDWFVDGATGIAHRFHVPDILIGATVVSIGTTLPEVMVSATSAMQGHGEIAYGNAIGSIICNTALIAGLSIAIRPSKVDRNTLKLPVTFFFIAAAIYTLTAYTSGEFSRGMGIILLLLFVLYMAVTIRQMSAPANTQPSGISESHSTAVSADGQPESAVLTAQSASEETTSSTVKDIVLLVVGAVLIAIGADLLVDNGTLIAEGLGVPESVIALTFVALGTSLPELVTAITSLVKGHSALSLGNIIGANLFNLVLVSGISSTLSPFHIPESKTIAGMNASLVVDLPLMLFVMMFLTLPALKSEKLTRTQGIVLLIIYAAFCIFQFI